MGSTQVTGTAGENYAAEYYKSRGFEIVARNFHSRYGEIDVIAENDFYIVFCEVKTRSVKAIERPSSAVTKAKIRKLTLTAMKFLGDFPRDKQPRSDVFEVWQSGKDIVKSELIEGAFQGEDFSDSYDVF